MRLCKAILTPLSLGLLLAMGPAGSVTAQQPKDADWARVTEDDERVEWALPSLPAGETTLTVRLRAAFRGRWAAPPASAMTEDPTGPLVRGAGSVLVVE